MSVDEWYAAGRVEWSVFGLEDVAEVLELGAEKHGAMTFLSRSDGDDVHYSKLMRHLMQWARGETQDEESGKNPMAHVIANAMMLHARARR